MNRKLDSLNRIKLQKTSDADKEEYIVEGLDENGDFLFFVVGDEATKAISIEFDKNLVTKKINLKVLEESLSEARKIVEEYFKNMWQD